MKPSHLYVSGTFCNASVFIGDSGAKFEFTCKMPDSLKEQIDKFVLENASKLLFGATEQEREFINNKALPFTFDNEGGIL